MIGAFISNIANNTWNISNHNDILMNIQTLNKNHSFIIRRSWDWIHINETSIEIGSQSRSWINIKAKTKQKNTQTNKGKTKQNVKNKKQKQKQKQKQNKTIIHIVTFLN
jgi:hypothetical protein